MAITKETVTESVQVLGIYKAVQCKEVTIFSEGGVEVSRSPALRHVLHPSFCRNNFDGTFTHLDTDISAEPAETQAICVAVWTDAVKAAWKTFQEESTLNSGAST